jgi:hypothetical protein
LNAIPETVYLTIVALQLVVMDTTQQILPVSNVTAAVSPAPALPLVKHAQQDLNFLATYALALVEQANIKTQAAHANPVAIPVKVA